MNNEFLCLEYYTIIPKEYEEIFYHGISEEAFQAKGLSPINLQSLTGNQQPTYIDLED